MSGNRCRSMGRRVGRGRRSSRGESRGKHLVVSLRSHTCHTHVAVVLGARERTSDGELFVTPPSSQTSLTYPSS